MDYNLNEMIVNRVNRMEGYTAKADCLETIEITLRSVGKYDFDAEEFINLMWDRINETHVQRVI